MNELNQSIITTIRMAALIYCFLRETMLLMISVYIKRSTKKIYMVFITCLGFYCIYGKHHWITKNSHKNWFENPDFIHKFERTTSVTDVPRSRRRRISDVQVPKVPYKNQDIHRGYPLAHDCKSRIPRFAKFHAKF